MEDLVKKIRRHLDKKGYRDIEMRVLGGYSWANADYKTHIAQAVIRTYKKFKVKYVLYPPLVSDNEFAPAWPACAFSKPPLNLPIAVGGLGHGDRAHSPDEYYVIEGAKGKHGEIYGLAGAEKSYATILYDFATSK